MLLWVDEAPIIPAEGNMSEELKTELINFLKDKITCEIPSMDEYPELREAVLQCQVHKHTKTCQRNRKNHGGKTETTYCRFGYPRTPTETWHCNTPEACVKSRARAGHRKQLVEDPRSSDEVNIHKFFSHFNTHFYSSSSCSNEIVYLHILI